MDIILSYFSVEKLLLLAAVVVFFMLELFYWLRIFGRVALQKLRNQPVSDKQPPVSIILSARNEYEMLQKNLPAILTQDYPDFEVIVVNDCSNDDSETLLASMQREYSNLVFRTIEEDRVFKHHKKMPLGLGIKAAKNELLLFIDADCYPSGTQWLRSMQRCFVEKKNLVIGYTRLENTAKWIRADHFLQGLHYLGKALINKAYMGSNSNLAYRRDLFFANKGFDVRVTDSLREDIILVNKVADRQNTAVALGAEATTVSTLRYTPAKWRRYRIDELRSLRLTGRGPHYPGIAEAIVRMLFFASIVVSAFVFWPDYIVLSALLGIVLLRFSGQTILYLRSQKRLGEKGLLPMLWIWDLFFPFYYFSIIFSLSFKRKKTWR